jgi:hypothetical protein
MINIVVTSKPVDGLLYYSYEYCDLLNKAGHSARMIIIRHRNYSKEHYEDSIKSKYTTFENVYIDEYDAQENDITLIMGRSMMTLSWESFNDYNALQQSILKKLFSGKVISVYSENHPQLYPKAVEFYNPQRIVDLCDTEVYPSAVGKIFQNNPRAKFLHFEKRINFSIYKPHQDDVQFKYLFLGTNEEYYAAAEKAIKDFPDYGILAYDAKYVTTSNNNIFVPVDNLLGIFDTYVYTKETFDPAPRIIQECKYNNKNMIYLRDKKIIDGGSVYWNRDIEIPSIEPILGGIRSI